MNHSPLPQAAPEPQSLRAQFDALAMQIQGKAGQIETMTDLAADVLSDAAGTPNLREAGHLVILIDLALAQAREAAKLGEQVEALCHRIPAELAA